jgi:hypothetical protein
MLTALCLTGGGVGRAPAADRSAEPRSISGSSPLPPGCGEPGAYRDTEVEPQVAVNPIDPDNIIAVWQQDRFSDGGSLADLVAVTHDGGATWKTVLVAGISRCSGGPFQRATDPWVSIGPEGTAYFLAEGFGPGPSALLVARSKDGGDTWSDPVTVVEDLVVISGDKGALTADPTASGYAYLACLGSPGNLGFFSRTTDGGQTWLPPLPLPIEGQGHLVQVLRDGTLVMVANGGGFMHASRSLNKGLTWLPPVRIGGADRPNPAYGVRDFNLPSSAVAPDGTVYVVWEDGLDVVMSQSTDGGLTWSASSRVSSGHLSYIPTVAVTRQGVVGVSYYDTRSAPDFDTPIADYWLTTSSDGGQNWSEHHLAGPFDLRRAPEAGGLFLGDYQGLAVLDGSFVPVFVQPADTDTFVATDVYFAVVAPA